MVKTVIKEVCIMVLLCIAVLLILGIVFYNYIPMNKNVPEKVAYIVPENVQEELSEQELKSETRQPITYSVTSSDLWTYQTTTVYQPGNLNPFKAYNTDNTNGTIIDGTTTSESSGQNGSLSYNQSAKSIK